MECPSRRPPQLGLRFWFPPDPRRCCSLFLNLNWWKGYCYHKILIMVPRVGDGDGDPSFPVHPVIMHCPLSAITIIEVIMHCPLSAMTIIEVIMHCPLSAITIIEVIMHCPLSAITIIEVIMHCPLSVMNV